MAHRVVFSPEARDDLLGIYSYIARRGSPLAALAFVERIEDYCQGFRDLPERGTRRDDLRRGLRVVGFERRVTIAFHVTEDAVGIDRILYGGRDLDTLLS